jgi:nitroreductase
MDAIEAIVGRRVARAFAKTPVEADKLAAIVEAGRHAMSARNLQPWQFIVIRNPDTLRALGALCATGRFVGEAPAAVAILKDKNNARWADVDCAQAVQNMANAAWALGLGTCWVGNFDQAGIAALLKLHADWPVFTILPFGYPDAAVPPQSRPLKKRSETVHYERYGSHKP